MLTANDREGLRLLGAYTAAGYDPWALAGGAKATCRAHIMSAFKGEKVSQKRAGVYDLLGELARVYPQGGRCRATWLAELRGWATGVISATA